MRVTACDVCKKTHPDTEPVGWIAIGFITDQPRNISTPFGIMTTEPKGHEMITWLLCGSECLSAFAEMESLKAVT